MNINYDEWIDRKVSKTGTTRVNRNPKPFKSGFKVNTVKLIMMNPNSGKLAFGFIEDDSLVDCHICELAG